MASLPELLAQIYADVHDLDARGVYADALLELGDPRGELIALQLERTRTRSEVTPRERALIKEHRATWLGPIAPVVSDGGSRFENGFLRDAQLHRVALTAVIADRDEWRTVERLDAASALREEATEWAITELIAALPQLETLEASLPLLDALPGRLEAHPLARLAVAASDDDPTILYELLEARVFDRLRWLRLSISGQPDDQVVRAGRHAGAGVELELLVDARPGPRLAHILERVVPEVRAVTLYAAWGRARATGEHGAVALQLFEPGSLRAPGFRGVIETLGPARVIVRLPPGIPPHAAGLAGFRVSPGQR